MTSDLLDGLSLGHSRKRMLSAGGHAGDGLHPRGRVAALRDDATVITPAAATTAAGAGRLPGLPR